MVERVGGVLTEWYEAGGCWALRMRRSCGNVDGLMWCMCCRVCEVDGVSVIHTLVP